MNKAINLDESLIDAFFYLGMSLYREKHFSQALDPLKIYRSRADHNLSASDLKKLDKIIEECQRNK
jgi:uncharacterized protein HemY